MTEKKLKLKTGKIEISFSEDEELDHNSYICNCISAIMFDHGYVCLSRDVNPNRITIDLKEKSPPKELFGQCLPIPAAD